MSESSDYECIIVGGGAAGLSAASVLARALRKTLVIDANQQSNTASRVAHSVFGHDGKAPETLYRNVRQQLHQYPDIHLTHDHVDSIEHQSPHLFKITTASGAQYRSKTVLLAQGVTYELPDIPGLAAIWGTKAWHCPYCDGYEHRDKKLLVISSVGGIEHMSLILPTWSKQLFYTYDKQKLPSFVQRRITTIGGAHRPPVAEINDTSAGVQVIFNDGATETFDAIVVGPSIQPQDSLADTLGCRRDNENCVARDELGRTSIEGVYTAGDQTDIMQQINVAVASGHKAAVAMHEDLARIDDLK